MTDKSPVTVDLDNKAGVARIAFNRPEVLNAIDIPTAQAFLEAVRRVTAEPELRCVILAGEGPAFVAGGDVARFADDLAKAGAVVDALLDALHPAILALRSTPAPVVAAVRGAAAGAGLSLMLSADFVVAADDARFVIAYDKVGAPPDCGGTWFLPRKVGRSRAFELMLLGTAIDAGTARAYGIVNEIVPKAEVETRAREVAMRIAAGPTKAYGAFKSLIDCDLPLAQHLEAERAAFVAATRTADFREGVSAFVEKRKPTFTGR
jgi:2-(1,2-epoxy-1,2-dihydrophenyl)acetyl-CoA isomerase